MKGWVFKVFMDLPRDGKWEIFFENILGLSYLADSIEHETWALIKDQI